MKEVVKLMDYRPDIKIVDATLRDGGLVNNFRFTDEFVKDLYQTNIKAGVDVMEFGYKADKEMFDVKDFGKWKFCDDEDIRAVVGDNNTDLKIAVMADVGRCNYKQDIKPRAESPVDVIRVATYINQIPAAVDVIEDAVAKGYEVTCNIMAISNAQEADIRVALDLLGKSPVNVIYIVDSFGALFPEQIARIAALYGEYAAKYGKKLGIHGTTTSSSRLQIRSRRWATALTGSTVHTPRWAEAPETVQWSCSSVSSRTRSTTCTPLFSSSRSI